MPISRTQSRGLGYTSSQVDDHDSEAGRSPEESCASMMQSCKNVLRLGSTGWLKIGLRNVDETLCILRNGEGLQMDLSNARLAKDLQLQFNAKSSNKTERGGRAKGRDLGIAHVDEHECISCQPKMLDINIDS